MAKLTRVTGKVFGSAATATVGGIGQFGSAKTGTPNPTTDVATIQALQAYLEGWGSAVITSRNFPPLEEVTGVLKTISYQACYTLQEGIPEYDVNTEYSNTSIVKSVNNGIITLYASLANNNTGNSLTDTDYWKPVVLDLDAKADTDLSNTTPAQTFVNTSIAWMMPDWSKAVSKTVGTIYTADQRGWINAHGSTTQGGIGVIVNSHWVAYTEALGAEDTSGFGCLIPVDIGDTYQGVGTNEILFIPCKGDA